MRPSVSLAHRDDDGCDDTEAASTTRTNEQYTWDEEIQELRQRLEQLELRRHLNTPQSREHDELIEKVGLLPNDDGAATTATTGYANNADDTPQLSSCTTAYKNNNNMMDRFELPESTYSLLMTEDICSLPFSAGIFAYALSLMCLLLVLLDELQNREPGNPLGVPAGLPPEVRMAQYLGIMIGVLMEDEIPTGLEIIGKGAEQAMSGGTKFSMKRIVFSSLLRLAVGYLFLLCLFLVVVQESSVLGIFFDVLALEFVENIDDVLFALFKRGFFGRKLRRATEDLPCIESSKDTHTFRKWAKRFIRFVYSCNVCLGIIYLTYLTIKQQEGSYRCTKILLAFGDELWEDAYVTTAENGLPERRLLIYSHFNGIYEEDGTHDGRPRYIERNKERGGAFEHVVPAQIVYCRGIEAWVFKHENIRTSLEVDNENPCSWLMKSQTTDSYDIISVGTELQWFVWKGLIKSKAAVSIECNQCNDEADCNYNGQCLDGECYCNEQYFGALCQFTKPCNVVRSEKDVNTTLQLIRRHDDNNFFESYGRPMYVIRNMIGKPYGLLRFGYPEIDEEYFCIEYPNSTEPDSFEDDDFFEQNCKNRQSEFEELMENYTFTLHYTGRRWYGDIFSPEMNETIFQDGGDYHAFWNIAFSGIGIEDNTTFLISAPTSGGSPVGVDFFETRRRNIVFDDDIHEYNYDPFGVLIPLVEYEGVGFFHCNNE